MNSEPETFFRGCVIIQIASWGSSLWQAGGIERILASVDEDNWGDWTKEKEDRRETSFHPVMYTKC